MIIVVDEYDQEHQFDGDELTSAAQQAILFLQEHDKENKEF